MRLAVIVAAVVLSSAPALGCDAGDPDVMICKVRDPTGTPLNVRESAAGRIVATLRNGQEIEVVGHVWTRGQRWARVAHSITARNGWVLKAHLQCDGTRSAPGGAEICVVRDPTGTPLNVRLDPGGSIFGTYPNGSRVRLGEEQTHRDEVWVMAERVPEDNVLGYVFDPHLKCSADSKR